MTVVRRSARKGSRVDHLQQMQVGDVRWIETTLETHVQDMKNTIVPRTRRPEALKDREFKTRFYTAVGTAAGDVRYLIRLERTQ
jgi:hypothetical protein